MFCLCTNQWKISSTQTSLGRLLVHDPLPNPNRQTNYWICAWHRGDICLQTLTSNLFWYSNLPTTEQKNPLSPTNNALVGTLITTGDVIDIFAIRRVKAQSISFLCDILCPSVKRQPSSRKKKQGYTSKVRPIKFSFSFLKLRANFKLRASFIRII